MLAADRPGSESWLLPGPGWTGTLGPAFPVGEGVMTVPPPSGFVRTEGDTESIQVRSEHPGAVVIIVVTDEEICHHLCAFSCVSGMLSCLSFLSG